MKGINIGILGTGNIVKKVHLPLLDEMRNVKFIALADMNYKRSQQAAINIQTPHRVLEVDELFADENLDVILIATPNFLHPAQVKRALLSGKHVICEKPLSISPVECKRILHLSKSLHRSVFICYANKFRADFQYLKKILDTNLLGKIKNIKAGWIRKNGIPGLNSWFTRMQYAGGGAVVDIGVHIIDLINEILGDSFERESWKISSRLFPIQKEDLLANANWYAAGKTAVLRNIDVEKGARAKITSDQLNIDFEVSWNTSTGSADKTYLQLDCEKGHISLSTLFGFSPNGIRPNRPLSIYFKKEDSLMKPCFERPTCPMQPYRNQWQYFLKHLLQDRLQTNMLRNEIRNAKVIQGIYKSAELGKTFELEFKKRLPGKIKI